MRVLDVVPDMSRTDDRARDDAADRERASRTGGWFAESTLRVVLAILGFVLLLFALGQAVGADLLGMVVQALNTQLGRWLIVALFALLLIALAIRGFGSDADAVPERDRQSDRNPDRDADRDYDHSSDRR